MKKIITEDLLQQIRLMNYDRSKTLQEQEQEFNNIRLLKEDCVQSMAMIDPKTGKGVYVDSVTGKPCTPKTPSSTKIVKKDNTIKPLWNTNIKEFVFPAYVEYLDVPKDKIYKKNADGTFSLKYPASGTNEKVSADSPEVIQKKKTIWYDDQFKKNITDKTSGDKFRVWVNDNPDQLKLVNNALKSSGINTSLDRSGPFDNDVIKIAYKTVGGNYEVSKIKPYSIESLYKGYLDDLENINTSSDDQQIAQYRKNPESLNTSITFMLSKLDQKELDFISKNNKYKDNVNWLEKYGEDFINKFTSEEYVAKDHLYGGYNLFKSAFEHRNKIKSAMMWTDQPKILLKDLSTIGNISRSTAIDPSYIISVLWVDAIQSTITKNIREEILNIKEKPKKPADYDSWSPDKQAQWTFDSVFNIEGSSDSEFLSKLKQDLKVYDDLISYIYQHNTQLLLQTPKRGTDIGGGESNIDACRKTITINKPVNVTDLFGKTVGQKTGTFNYSMTNVCKNYGGLWLNGVTSMASCCCVNVPVDKPTYPSVSATLIERDLGAGGDSQTRQYYANIKINLIRSCERTKDIRNLTERASDQVRDCSQDYHCWLDIASIAALIIPGVGIVVSALIDVANAATYLVEAGLADNPNDRNEALLGAGFSMLGAITGGGGTTAKYLTKGVSKEVQMFGKEYVTIVYEVYGKAGKIESDILKEELEGAFELLARKRGLSEAEQKVAKTYLSQVSKLNTAAFDTYVKSVQSVQDKIGLANMRRIGSEPKFIELLNKENGDVITALSKYTKSEAGREALTELGLYVVLADYLPTLQVGAMQQASETGKIPVIGSNTPLSVMVQTSGYDLASAQEEFGSTKSKEDNEKMRLAWLDMWRPGMAVTELDQEDYRDQISKFEKKLINYTRPKFKTTKFSKYATNFLKNKLIYDFQKILEKEKESKEREERLKQIYVVSDEDYERESQLSNKVVIKKSVSDKKDTSRLSGDKVSKEDESLDDFKY